MSRKEWQAAVEALQSNRTISRFETLWKGLQALLEEGAPEASGWIETALEPCQNGSTRVVRLRGRKPIRAAWNVPTMVLDALLDVELVRPYWPQVEMVADVSAETPHQRVVQVEDVSFSKRRLLGVSIEEPDDAAGEDEKGDKPSAVNERAARRLRDLHAGIAAIGRAYAPGRVLVVTQKAVEGALPAFGRLPPNIALAHHNAVAGRDQWKDVAALVAVGRTMPSPADVERVAEALTGAATARLGKGQWYPRIVTSREMMGGRPVTAEADRHPDPMAERVRWQVAEGELIQIIGRARGVNRGEANPVDIYLLTNVPLPLPVQNTITAADLRPSPVELMMAAGGVAFLTPIHAAQAYPKLWDTYNAAKMALKRCRQSHGDGGQSGIYRSLIPVRPPLPDSGMQEARYQLSGERMKPVTAWFDPAVVADPRATIERLLGTRLACCKRMGPVLQQSEHPTAAPAPAASEKSDNAAD